jgi:hypothetical protein
VEACTNPRAGGQSGSLLARRGQARGFDSPTHIACPARNTGDRAQRTAHHQVQIHDGEGGIGETPRPFTNGTVNCSGRRPAMQVASTLPGRRAGCRAAITVRVQVAQLAYCGRGTSTGIDANRCGMAMIQSADTDFRVCRISFEMLLEIQMEAQERGLATRWSPADALRGQVMEGPVILQSLMREERAGAVRSYRCLVLFSMADGLPSGGLATIDVAPSRFESLEQLDQNPDVSQVFALVFALASGGISMISKA